MYLSKLFIPLLKETPSEAKVKSHQLMLRAGMIKQSSAGIYSWLPIGFKVLKNIEMLEIKQGPYSLSKDKVKFENIDENKIRIKK